MPLPSNIGEMIRQRFVELLNEAGELHKQMAAEDRQRRDRLAQRSVYVVGELDLVVTEFTSLRTRFLSLAHLLPTNAHLSKIIEAATGLESHISSVEKLMGFIDGLKKDYESGMLQNLTEMIEANIASDYMGQAEQLLGEGVSGQYDHVPAAVLAGAVLEDALRRLCQRQSPPIDILKANGDKKTLDPLITDLQKANIFNKAKADLLRSWAKTRNYAAHGEFGEFTRSEVEAMIAGVKVFIADYL